MVFNVRVRTWSAGWCGQCAGVVLILVLAGCDAGPELTPVRGRVLYNGQPLPFGVVMFHPQRGQVAQAEIQSDGAFDLSTYQMNDGIAPGLYRASVICFEAHDPNGSGAQEMEGGAVSLGKPLIPLKYTRARTSGLTVSIDPAFNEEIRLELTGPEFKHR